MAGRRDDPGRRCTLALPGVERADGDTLGEGADVGWGDEVHVDVQRKPRDEGLHVLHDTGRVEPECTTDTRNV